MAEEEDIDLVGIEEDEELEEKDEGIEMHWKNNIDLLKIQIKIMQKQIGRHQKKIKIAVDLTTTKLKIKKSLSMK